MSAVNCNCSWLNLNPLCSGTTSTNKNTSSTEPAATATASSTSDFRTGPPGTEGPVTSEILILGIFSQPSVADVEGEQVEGEGRPRQAGQPGQ